MLLCRNSDSNRGPLAGVLGQVHDPRLVKANGSLLSVGTGVQTGAPRLSELLLLAIFVVPSSWGPQKSPAGAGLRSGRFGWIVGRCWKSERQFRFRPAGGRGNSSSGWRPPTRWFPGCQGFSTLGSVQAALNFYVFAASSATSSFFDSLPTKVLGSSSRNSMSLGISCFPSLGSKNSRNSSAVSAAPSANFTKALMR